VTVGRVRVAAFVFLTRPTQGILPRREVLRNAGRNAVSSLLSALGIDHLSVPQRIQLAHELWDSIAAEAGALPLTEAQKAELDRRLAALDADPSNVVPWEEVEARALARFRK
jgi:putative addiction module component (TIGR02574 family)